MKGTVDPHWSGTIYLPNINMTPRISESIKTPYSCEQCDKLYAAKSSLYSHKKAKHNVSIPQLNVAASVENLFTSKTSKDNQEKSNTVKAHEKESITEEDILLNVDDEVIVDSSEEQDLYKELDKSTQDIQETEKEPEKEKET